MSILFLKGSRTKYRDLLERELEKGRSLVEEATLEQYEIKIVSKRLRNCINRLNEIIEKLEQTDERLSVVIDGHDGAQEVEQLITEDWSYIAEVIDSRYELEDIQQTLQDQMSPQENFKSRTFTECKFNQMIQLTVQMQQVLTGQKQFQQQQLKSDKPSKSGGDDCIRRHDSTGGEDCNRRHDNTGGEDCNRRHDNTGGEDATYIMTAQAVRTATGVMTVQAVRTATGIMTAQAVNTATVIMTA